MKKTYIILIIVVILSLLGGLIYSRFFKYSEEFDFNSDTKLIVSYTTGSKETSMIDFPEKAQIFQLDSKGNVIEKNSINSMLSSTGIKYNKDGLEIFTNDNIYIMDVDKKLSTLNNPDFKEFYQLSNDNYDDVYDYEYKEKYNTSVRLVPHGLSYDMKEKGFIDILVFNTESKVYNIEVMNTSYNGIVEGTSQEEIIIVDSATDINTGEGERQIRFQVLKYNDKIEEYELNDEIIKVTYNDNNTDEDVEYVYTYASIYYDGFIYLDVFIRNEETEEGRREVLKIDLASQEIVASQSLSEEEGDLEFNTIDYFLDDDTIYYIQQKLVDGHETYRIVNYNLKTNTIVRNETLDFPIHDGVKPDYRGVYFKRKTNGDLYAMLFVLNETDDKSSEVFKINYQNNTYKSILKFTFPEPEGFVMPIVSDFEVIE